MECQGFVHVAQLVTSIEWQRSKITFESKSGEISAGKTRWAPTSSKWGYNPCKWPCKGVSGVILIVFISPHSYWFFGSHLGRVAFHRRFACRVRRFFPRQQVGVPTHDGGWDFFGVGVWWLFSWMDDVSLRIRSLCPKKHIGSMDGN